MDELTRFARVLVERLAAQPGGASNGPVSVAAIRKQILPYRAERRNLGLSSVEDYEMVLLRLVAEEKGFVKTAPRTAVERCREILAHPNPDLGVLEELADSTIQFTSLAAGPIFDQEEARTGGKSAEPPAGGPDGRTVSSPPDQKPAKIAATRAPTSGASDRPDRPPVRPSEPPSQCPHCNGSLPSGRVAVFCPWCGDRLVPLLCDRCGTEFESGWRHCITCGSPVRDPYRPS